MAQIESLGVHTPVGLSYLINEGLLPREPQPNLYTWSTYSLRQDDFDVEEEILSTVDTVVWSQGCFIRAVYRFNTEGGNVVQALLTNFPSEYRQQRPWEGHSNPPTEGYDNMRTAPKFLAGKDSSNVPNLKALAASHPHSTRALTVLLKSKLHVFFLEGASYIVSLPFEIERIFPAAEGLVLQRKTTAAPKLGSMSQIPRVPQNSFLSSQSLQLSQEALASTQRMSIFSLGTSGQSLTNQNKLSSLYHSILHGAAPSSDEEPVALFSLTNPLADLGTICSARHHFRARGSGHAQPQYGVDFDMLPISEKVVYVSDKDELDGNSPDEGQLMLIATVNTETNLLTIWHAWHIKPTDLHDVMIKRKAHKADKARRRSSFISANVGTGAVTPAPRTREALRESFAGNTRQVIDTQGTTKKGKRQDEEAAMASQMDPDFAAPTKPRDNRRVSGVNAESRTGHGATSTSFGPAASRRSTFLASTMDRRSFGLRKSRGSTPGSVFSRSIGLDDSTMDIDSDLDLDGDTSVDDIVEHMRAAQEAAAADDIIGESANGFRRELILRKIHSLTWNIPDPSAGDIAETASLIVMPGSRPRYIHQDTCISVLVQNRLSKSVTVVKISVQKQLLWPKSPTSVIVPIPIVTREESLGSCSDLLPIRHRSEHAVLLAGRGLVFAEDTTTIIPLPTQAPYRRYPADAPIMSQTDKDIGKNRILQAPRYPLSLSHSGPGGLYDESDNTGILHRRRLYLSPSNGFSAALLQVVNCVLRPQVSISPPQLWCAARAYLADRPDIMAGTVANADLVAVIATVVFLVMPILDSKALAAIKIAELASGNRNLQLKDSGLSLSRSDEATALTSPAWTWTKNTQASATIASAASQKTGKSMKNPSDKILMIAARVADRLSSLETLTEVSQNSVMEATTNATSLLLGFHIYREELKLNLLSHKKSDTNYLTSIITQLGLWLGLSAWAPTTSPYYQFEPGCMDLSGYIESTPSLRPALKLMDEPVSVCQWFEFAVTNRSKERYPLLSTLAGIDEDASLSESFANATERMTPRLSAVVNVLVDTTALSASAHQIIQALVTHKIDREILDTLPDGIAIPFREAIARCEREPLTAWPSEVLDLIGREDLEYDRWYHEPSIQHATPLQTTHNMQVVCNGLDQIRHAAKSKEANRHAISQLIFNEDRRLIDVVTLMHFNNPQTAECVKRPDWSDAQHFEMQRQVVQWASTRMVALPAGDGMVHYDSQTPLLTQKYHLTGFSASCLIQPMGHTLTIDRNGMTEEKVNWAYFHLGVSAGLRISRHARGIDTSWIAFNKPFEPTHRHAGLLLALGLNGQLRSLAKWLAFKYLTKKHDMTSVGLLLGLSASYMGSMDSLITRMLSVHITRMLPPGAAELNISPLTQTAGLMGIGLLYHNTQHRRMSEIMLSEIEHMELEDPDSGPDQLRDEAYRLAAGFALGFINVAKGKDLRGLHGMRLPERLLGVAVGPRPVSAVHVFDRATAGAIVAVALIYMKSRDKAVARKIDIPDTEAQYDHVRPDMLLLRAMTKHLILWDSIVVDETGSTSWIVDNLPACHRSRMEVGSKRKGVIDPVRTTDLPFYNILTGLVWAIALKYTGSYNEHARDEICKVIDFFYTLREGGEYFYDAKLARATIRRCIDVCAVSMAMVMAGTGDLKSFRYLRRLHGRIDAETPYGSHLAAHMAIGLLFLAGGTYTLGTTDLALASLICAFYPLYPTDVQDNCCHLQAFRHLWVFAAEARCILVEDIDTGRPITMPIIVILKDGTSKQMRAPCLLPELDTIDRVKTINPSYRTVTLDFSRNPSHLASFRKNQRIFVRSCPAAEAHSSVFSATLAALNEAQSSQAAIQIWNSIFNLATFRDFSQIDMELVLPPDPHSSVYTAGRGTVVDDRLALAKYAAGNSRDELWSLRLVLKWAENVKENGEGKLRWIGHEIIENLQASIDSRSKVGH